MAISLSSISKGKARKAPRIMLLGVEKIGKSRWASQAPGAIFIPIRGEQGLDHIDAAKFPVCESFADLMGCLESLCKESQAVAKKHYLQVTDSHFEQAIGTAKEKAAHFTAHSASASIDQDSAEQITHTAGDAGKAVLCAVVSDAEQICTKSKVPPRGVEEKRANSDFTVKNADVSTERPHYGAKSGALDAELREILSAWASLPASARRVILALVRGKVMPF